MYKINPCFFAEKCIRVQISVPLNDRKSDICNMIDHSIKHSTMLFCKAEPFLDAKLIKIFFGGKLLKCFLFQLSHKNDWKVYFTHTFNYSWSSMQFVQVLLEKCLLCCIDISLVILFLQSCLHSVIHCLCVWVSFSCQFIIILLFTRCLAIIGPFQRNWIPEHNPDKPMGVTFVTFRFKSCHIIHDCSFENDLISLIQFHSWLWLHHTLKLLDSFTSNNYIAIVDLHVLIYCDFPLTFNFCICHMNNKPYHIKIIAISKKKKIQNHRLPLVGMDL